MRGLAKGLWSRVAPWMAEETGQMLVWTLIITVAGGLIIGGFLVYATTSLLTTSGTGDQSRLYYTADAGAQRCLVSLTVGDSNCNFTFSLNGYTGLVTISGPFTGIVPSGPRYAATGVITLGAGEAWLLELDSRPITFQVNWAFDPSPLPAGSWELRLYKGGNPVLTDALSIVTSNTGIWSPAQLPPGGQPPPVLTDGVYTLIFWNSAATSTITAAPFSASGGVSNTWVWANAYHDYMITSTVENLVLEVIARQAPGSTLITNPITVTVLSWQLR